jgi:hypothetical protein
MAVVRTVLPRKGIIQPQHGDNYEADLDANWLVIDSSLQDAADVQAAVTAAGTVSTWLSDSSLSGVISGFDLATSATLVPGVATGVLYAQGNRYAPGSAPSPGAAPASSTSYLFYNSTTGFYYNLTGTPAVPGDAFLGKVTTDAVHVTAIQNATKLHGQVAVTAPAPGGFNIPHFLGRTPVGAIIRMTSAGAVWWQSPTDMDTANLYLVASDTGVTAKVMLW